MALTTYSEYLSAINDFNNQYIYTINSGSLTQRPFDSFFVQTYPSGTATNWSDPTPRQLTKNDTGAIQIPTVFSGGTLRWLGVEDYTQTMQVANVLIDRLVEIGRISGNTTATQTIPSVDLPRYTAGTRVVCYLTATGTTTTDQTVTITYTNQDGVSGRTGYCRFGGNNLGGTRSSRFMQLMTGDTGVRSIQTVTNGGTIVTGFYNIVLAQPLGMFMNTSVVPQLSRGLPNLINGYMVGGLPEIDPNACLTLIRANPRFETYQAAQGQGSLIIKEV